MLSPSADLLLCGKKTFVLWCRALQILRLVMALHPPEGLADLVVYKDF